MDPMTLSELSELCGGTLRARDAGISVRHLSKDTRTLAPGDVYLGLRGENHDGNAFARQAAERGAAAVILDNPAAVRDLPDGVAVLSVDDSLEALHRLAGAWRDRLALKVLCITGSSGKTSTKEFAAAVLAARYRVTRTTGNLNNHIGLPLSILDATTADDAAVWEIGMNHPGEIAPLARLARPQVAIITNIGVAHIEYLGSREAIAREKGTLAAEVGPHGAVIVSAEDEFTPVIAGMTRARIVSAGLAGGDVTATDVSMDADGCRFRLQAGGESAEATIAVPGEHMVRNALLAVAAGIEFGLSLEECAEGLAGARLTGGRLARRTVRGVTLLDDTYNANPDSMEAALRTLGGLPCSGRRVAVLGTMGELGDHATEGYQRVGRAAARHADALIAVGSATTPMTESARAGGMRDIHETSSTAEAAAVLRRVAAEGDVVLVKGSRSARMERVLEDFSN